MCLVKPRHSLSSLIPFSSIMGANLILIICTNDYRSVLIYLFNYCVKPLKEHATWIIIQGMGDNINKASMI